MSQEISPIELYPDIDWSKEYLDEHQDPQSTYGLIGVRIGSRGFQMNHEHQFVSLREDISNVRSRLFLGYPGSKRLLVVANPDNPFSLEDATRINQAITGSRELITAFYQWRTAHKISSVGDLLLETLKGTAEWNDPSLKEGAGIIEGLVNSVKTSLLPDKILKSAQRMNDLGIEDVQETFQAGAPHSYAPWWILENPVFQSHEQDVVTKKDVAKQPISKEEPTHIVILNIYTEAMTSQSSMLNATGAIDQTKLEFCEEIFLRSQVPSQDIPAMIEHLSQLRQSLNLDTRNFFARVLQSSLDRIVALLTPPEKQN